jgi:hypothetical protein|nr:MAG TPA: hypothetical protein [Caudoviricetes sp.]
MSIISEKAKYLIENDGVPTSGGLLTSQMTKKAVIHVVEIAEEEMKQKAIEAFKSMTDSSTDRLDEFIDKLNS